MLGGITNRMQVVVVVIVVVVGQTVEPISS